MYESSKNVEWSAEFGERAAAISPLIEGTEFFDQRWDIAWYVALCERSGFCSTYDERQNCARRYMAGKRKVSPPGTRHRKEAAKNMRKLLSSPPPELITAIEGVVNGPVADQFRSGNAKAMNALVGAVIKQHKSDPAAVRELLTRRLSQTH